MKYVFLALSILTTAFVFSNSLRNREQSANQSDKITNGIVDIVETGATLRENGLDVLEEICPLSARMVVNQVSMKMENERINRIINDLRKYLENKE